MLGWAVGGLQLLTMPLLALAQNSDEVRPDARLEGYGKTVSIGESTSLTWLLLVFLGVVCVAPLFMNARRTHLD